MGGTAPGWARSKRSISRPIGDENQQLGTTVAVPRMRGKLVLITGATGGIGRAIAAGIAAQGATTVIVGRDPERAAAAVADIRQATGNPSRCRPRCADSLLRCGRITATWMC
jgi:FlaA1/EpsC-like NDP-sugar epimerase